METLYTVLAWVGLLLSLWLFWQLLLGIRSLNWPSVVGEIIMKDLDPDVRSTLRHPNRYVYRYNVRGVDYFSQRVTVSDPFVPRARKVERVLEKHPDGAMVTVYYQKHKPQSALLERGVRRETVIVLLLALMLCVSCFYAASP